MFTLSAFCGNVETAVPVNGVWFELPGAKTGLLNSLVNINGPQFKILYTYTFFFFPPNHSRRSFFKTVVALDQSPGDSPNHEN